MENKNSSVNAAGSNFGVMGWTMIGYVFLVYFVNCLIGNSWQIATEFWEESYGWNSTVLLSANSYGQILSVVTGLILGRLMIKRVDAKVFSIIIGILTCVCFVLISYSPSYILALILIILCACFVQNWAYNINPVFIANWFPRKKGVVMGWATIGIPLGAGTSAAILYAVAGRSSINMGMNTIALIGVGAILLSIFFVKTDPTDRKFSPDNDKSMTMADVEKMRAEEQAIADKSPWTFKRVVATKEVWLLAIPLGLEQLIASGNMMTLVPRMIAMGYDTTLATRLIMAAAFIACPCSFLMGFIDGKIGPKRANIICIIAGILSSVFMMIGTMPCMIISIIFLGFIVGGVANFATSVTVTYWGRANFTKVYSILCPICFLLGGLGSAVTMGIAALAHNNYNIVSLVFALLFVLSLILFVFVKPGFSEKREATFKEESE